MLSACAICGPVGITRGKSEFGKTHSTDPGSWLIFINFFFQDWLLGEEKIHTPSKLKGDVIFWGPNDSLDIQKCRFIIYALVMLLQRNRNNRISISWKEIYKELVHSIMETIGSQTPRYAVHMSKIQERFDAVNSSSSLNPWHPGKSVVWVQSEVGRVNTQKNWCFVSNQEGRKRWMPQLEGGHGGRINFTLGCVYVRFFVFRFSTNWVKPTHIKEGECFPEPTHSKANLIWNNFSDTQK